MGKYIQNAVIGALHPTEIIKTAPSWLLRKAEADEGAEWVGVRVVHSYSSVDCVPSLAEGLAKKSVGYNPATAHMESLPARNMIALPDRVESGLDLTMVEEGKAHLVTIKTHWHNSFRCHPLQLKQGGVSING